MSSKVKKRSWWADYNWVPGWARRLHKRLKKWWAHINRHLGKMWVRLGFLIAAALIGIALVYWGSPWILCFFPESTYGDIRTVIGVAPLTLPVFLALWWFRTYDSLQSEWRANFEAGVDHLASNTPARIEIGTEMLKNVSKVTSIYNREISTAFIQRLNQSPAEAEANRKLLETSTGSKYAQQMLKWLLNQNEKYDLDFVDLRNQNFTDVLDGITVCDLLNVNKDGFLTLEIAHCNLVFVKEMFNCCPAARRMCVKAKKMDRWQIEHADEVALPSNQVTVSRATCGKNSKPPTNTAK